MTRPAILVLEQTYRDLLDEQIREEHKATSGTARRSIKWVSAYIPDPFDELIAKSVERRRSPLGLRELVFRVRRIVMRLVRRLNNRLIFVLNWLIAKWERLIFG
jgi:hypothetical protein